MHKKVMFIEVYANTQEHVHPKSRHIIQKIEPRNFYKRSETMEMEVPRVGEYFMLKTSVLPFYIEDIVHLENDMAYIYISRRHCIIKAPTISGTNPLYIREEWNKGTYTHGVTKDIRQATVYTIKCAKERIIPDKQRFISYFTDVKDLIIDVEGRIV